MPAGNYNITAEQGATFTRVLTWTDSANAPINLTGYTARMQVRTDYASDSTVLSLTTENNAITLGGLAGTITLSISASSMTSIPVGIFVYDLELVSGTLVVRLVEGTFSVKPEVTR